MPRAPAFSALFLLSEPVSGRAFRGQVEDSVTDEPEGALVRHAGGWESGDFLWTDRALVCVSERVLRTLRVNAITGWEAGASQWRSTPVAGGCSRDTPGSG